MIPVRDPSAKGRPFVVPMLLALTLLVAGCYAAPGRVPEIVNARDATALVRSTASGDVRGVATPQGQVFLGIPFAAPPIGERRFSPPIPPAAWAGIRPAVAAGADCAKSEDCLNLNIYAPHDASAAHALPVMVWIYGGAFILGANDQYDLSAMAERQRVVIVAPNYRLGALGFLAHPALAGPGEGSYGLLDQQAALRWVQANIAMFGGDPAAVTAFGQSAGAFSVCSQMTSPGGKGLFARVILQSGACIGKHATVDRATAEKAGIEIASGLGCADPSTALACLRKLPHARFAHVASRRLGLNLDNGWTPMHGGDVLPDEPGVAFAQGRSTAVPMINGTTAREGTLFAYLFARRGKLLSQAAVRKTLAESFAEDAPAVLREYGALLRTSRWNAVAQIVTDGRFACPAFRMNRVAAARAPLWAYEFDDPRAPFGLPRVLQPRLGAYHASEIAYVFQRAWLLSGALHFTPAQRALSDRLQDHWGQFARTGNPNADGPPAWPRIAEGDDPAPLTVAGLQDRRAFATRHRCDFWNRLGY